MKAVLSLRDLCNGNCARSPNLVKSDTDIYLFSLYIVQFVIDGMNRSIIIIVVKCL